MADPQQPESAYDAFMIAQDASVKFGEKFKQAQTQGNQAEAEKYYHYYKEAELNAHNLEPLAAKEEQIRRGPILQQLESGTYADKPVVPSPGIQAEDVSKPNMLRRKLADLYRTDPGNVDITSGLGNFETRARMSVAREPEQKFQILRDSLGDANIAPVNINGKPNFVIRKPDGKILLVDEVGASTGDIADVAADTARTAAEVGVSIAASAISKRPISASAFAAAGANMLLGTGQRVGANSLTSRELDVIDEFMSQVPEALVTGGTDAIGGVLVSKLPWVRKMGLKNPNEYAKSIDEAVGRLQRKNIIGKEVNLGPEMRSPEATAEAQMASGLFRGRGSLTGSTFNRGREKIIEDLASWQRKTLSGELSPRAEFDTVVNRLQGEADMIFSEVRNIDYGLAKNVKDMLEQRIQGEGVQGRFDRETTGNTLKGLLKQAEEQEIALKNAAWDGFYAKSTVEVSPEDALRVFKSAYDESASQGLENPAVETVVSRLQRRVDNTKELSKIREKITSLQDKGKPVPEELAQKASDLALYSGNMDLKTFKNYMDRIGDPIPSTGAIAQGTPVRAASITSGKVNEYWNQLIAANGLGPEFKAINQKYAEDMLLFRRNSVGAMVKEHLGDSSLAPEEMVSAALRNSRSVDDVLKAVKLGSPDQHEAVLGSLQRAYLDQIGMTGDKAGGKFNYDVDMLSSLFGRNTDGGHSRVLGEMMGDRLDKLALAFDKVKIKPRKLNADDINELASVNVSNTLRDTTIRMIVERERKMQDAEAFLGKQLLGYAEKGKLHLIDNDMFAQALASGRSDQVRRVMATLPEDQRRITRQDFIANMMKDYHGDPTPSGSTLSLWDANGLLSDFARNPVKERNARIILGDEFVNDLKAASIVQKTAMPAVKKPIAGEAKMAYTPGGNTSIYVVGHMAKWLKYRGMAAAYGTGILQKTMRESALKGVPIDPIQFQKTVMPKLFGTGKGVEAVFTNGRNDPEFRAWLAEVSGQVNEEDRKYQEIQGQFQTPAAK